MHTQSLAGDRMEYIEGKGADHALMVMIIVMRRRRMMMVMVMIKSSYQFDLNETPTVHSGSNTKLEFRPFLGFNCSVLFVFDCCLQRESESGDFSNGIGWLAWWHPLRYPSEAISA